MSEDQALLTGRRASMISYQTHVKPYHSIGKRSVSIDPSIDVISTNSEPESTILATTDITTVNHWSEFSFVVESSFPLIITFLLQYLIAVTSIFVAGQLGSKELAASSLAICTFNITGLAIYQGSATCLDSFCSQSYGARRYHLVGLYFQRCCAIMLTATIPLSLLWWFSASFLNLMVPDKELAHLTQIYLRYLIPGAPGLMFFENGKRYLQSQNIFNASTYVLAFAAPLNISLNWVLVLSTRYGLGFIGAPISVSITYWVMSFFLLGYVVLVDGKQCWGGLKIKESFQNWGPMWELALPGIIMVEAEYLAFEVLTILAAIFGTEALAAQSIVSNLGSLAFQVPFAVAVAISTRIGNFVGGGLTDCAKIVTHVSIFLAGIISIFNFSVMFFGRYKLSGIFTRDDDVINLSAQVLVLAAANQLWDPFNVLCAGILRGQGRQKIGSILNLACYYIIALPLGYVLAFHFGGELIGLWIGLILGVAGLTISEVYFVYNSDWDLILSESLERYEQ